MIEQQSRYINVLIKPVLDARHNGGSLIIQPKESRVKEFNTKLQKSLNKTSFGDSTCSSWYKMKDSGKITNNWSGNVIEYQKVCWNRFFLSSNIG